MCGSNADVIVTGGGTAGFAAAVSAAKCGKKAILVEKEISLGGIGTNGLLGEINAPSVDGEFIISDTGLELVEDMILSGNALLQKNVPMTSNENITVDRLRYNGEYMKLAMENIAFKYGVNILYGADVCAVQENEEGISVTVKNGFEEITLKSKAVVDATGNALTSFLAGVETIETEERNIQSPSMIFRLGGVDKEKFNSLMPENIKEIIKKGRDENILPAKILSMLVVPNTDSVAVNCTRIKGLSGFGIIKQSKAVIESRRQIERIFPFLKENVPGLKNAYVSALAVSLGMRDRRHIKSVKAVTGTDILNGTKFPDRVSCCGYPVDIHKNDDVCFMPLKNKISYVPLSAMLPVGSKRIIACGKCIDADDTAYGSIRVMSSMFNIGEACGIAVSQMSEDGFRDFDYTALLSELVKRHMKI